MTITITTSGSISEAETEEWRPVPGRENLYGSSLGRIGRKRPSGEWKILRGSRGYKGYWAVHIPGTVCSGRVHLLICAAFHGPKPPPLSQCCHGDGNKDNNRPSNLRWGTQKDNMSDNVRHGVFCGVKNGAARLTEDQVLTIRASDLSCRELAKMFGVSDSAVREVIKGETWKHLPSRRAPDVQHQQS